MSKRALYREYRPFLFGEVIGQDHITTILKNQVREQNFSHAYLFCGSRGTGKTSSAKILSRAVNCLDPNDGEPCGKCEACRIAKEGSADIIEIDAASNNGVDNVRDLIDQAQFAPLQLKYRVFIVDEVHMLSTAAFNALLKTLEEPPKHVLFILATTEPQKLPATIISRCQRFDFHRLSIAHIVARLQTVLQNIGAVIEPDGLRLIARAADGGMRDALSLADQCLSFCGNTVTKQDVLDTLGGVGQETLFALSGAIFSGDAAGCLSILNDVVRGGRDLGVFTADLNAHLRSLLLAKTCGACAELLDITDDQMDQLLKQAKASSEAQILYASEQLLKAQSNLRYFPSPRILLETTLVRICRPVDEHTIEALESRIAQLEQNGVRVASSPQRTETEKNVLVSAAREVPPWEEKPASIETGESVQKPEKAEKKADKRKTDCIEVEAASEKAAAPESQTNEPPPRADAGETDAAKLWNAVLNRIKVKNPMVYYLAKEGHGAVLNGDVLTVEFSAGKESQMTMCDAAINRNVIVACLIEERAGASVLFRAEQLNEKEKRVKELFGSALTIREE